MGRLLLCAALLCLVTWARSEIQYALTTPAMLVSGSTAKACVNIVGTGSVTLDVTVSLEYSGRNTSVIAENTASSPKYFQCGTFKVPSVSEAVPVALIFSANAPNIELRDRKTVVIKPAPINCMYQMDKPIYKPGQQVKWRLLCLDAQLKVVNEKITSMYLQDPSRTKIAHWPNPDSQHGVVTNEFQLIPDAPLGSYVITAERETGYPISQYFRVEQYIAPRFEVKVDSPSTVATTVESAPVKVSAMYTYGEPVAGSVTIRYCMQARYYGRRQNCFPDKGNSCANMTGVLGADGTYSGEIHLSGGRSFTMDVTVTEAGTGIQTTETRYTWVTSQPASLSFDYDSMRPCYKRGLIYYVVAQLTDESSKPMPNQEIDVQINNGEVKKAMTDSEGRLNYPIDTTNMVETNFTVKISYTNQDQCYFSEWSEKDYPSTEYTVQRFYSYSGSFIQMKRPKGELSSDKGHSIDVDYIISPEGTGEKTATFYYLVVSNSAIVQSGQKDVDLSGDRNGSFSFDLPVSYVMAPSADLIVYSILQNEMITDTTNLNIEKAFKNQVSMTFSPEKAVPGSTVDVQISADPNSLCALRVIDYSLVLLNQYEQFSADGVYSSRRIYYYGYNVGGFDLEDQAPPCEDPDKEIFWNGRYYTPQSSKAEGDAYKNVKDVGLLVGGNVILRRPEVCDKNPPQLPMVSPNVGYGGASGGVAKLFSADADVASSSRSASIETVRKNFAETFFWIIFPVNTEGKGTASETVPDTITSWQGTAFCTSEETGFGMTKVPANLTTFIPFFMELSLPYSCIRGEALLMKGVASNYMEKTAKVQVDMAPSNAFTATMKDGTQDVCVPSGGRAAYTWEMQPTMIGEVPITVSAQTTSISDSCDGQNDPTQPPRKDTVVQTVLVDAEGIPQERTSSHLVLAQNGKNTQLPISLTPPADVVPDSSTASVTAVSDLFGVPLQNLNDMLHKPYGCADQNLARVAVIPPIIEYLNNTGQLTEEIKQKAIGYMAAGYQRHLEFVYGGAYRQFPNSIEVNSVTTAETFKIFEKLKKYIYIDETRQQQTLIWLENSQKLENGCFKAQGKPVTNQDGDTDVHYTAFIAIALLESDYSLGNTLLKGALECLKTASKSEQTISVEALMCYAFTLAEMEDYRKPLLEKLMKKAKTDDGTMHWERPDMPGFPKGPYFMPRFPPAEVWITSYMLLCTAHNPNRTPEDLKIIAQISVWLVRQQNSYGGFSSSRDTAVAIQALAAVAALFSTPNSQQTVTISKGNGEVATIYLNQDNRIVTHRQALPEASGDYLIDVSGNGWCLIQTTVKFNVPVSKENSAYSLSMSTSPDSCLNGVGYRIPVNCILSYRGSHNESGLTMFTMRKLSGYNADYSSLYKLKDDKIISKFEETPKGDINMYMENVPREPVHFTVHLLMGPRVLNIKRSFANVYSYYEPSENGQASYYHPCTNPTEDGESTRGSSPAVGPKDHMKLSGSRPGAVGLKPYGVKSKKQA